MGREYDELNGAARFAAKACGVALAWAPFLVDTLGQGSEIEMFLIKELRQ